MNNWGISGHKKQISFLNRSLESGKISHGFIFSGPSFVGKKSVALQLAKKLLDSPDSRLPTPDFFHPDFIEVGGDDYIKIEQVRDLVYKLALKPYQAKYKVALIDNAENMTLEAQNALLKLLEEPKEYTVIILVTSNSNKLLRTISSRAQKINFGLVETSDYASLLPKDLDASAAKLITVVAAGRPGLALKISGDEQFLQKLRETNEFYRTIRGNDLVEKLKLAYELADLETGDLKQVIDFWQIMLEKELIAAADTKVAKNLNALNQARKYLDQNVNSKLMLTNLMLALN